MTDRMGARGWHWARMRGLPLLALLALVLTALPLVPALAQKACGEPHAKRAGDWTVLTGPAFSSGGLELTATGVAYGGARTTVTNGSVVATTSDISCAWSEIWPAGHTNPLTDPIAARPGESVATVIAAQSQSAPNTIFLLLQSQAGGAANMRLLSTTDAGGTWKVSQTPLVAATNAASGGRCEYPNSCRLISPAANPRRVFLSFATPEGGTALYVSDDGGDTFANRTDAALLVAGISGGFADVEAHPTNADTLWATTREGAILVTTDAGRTFRALNTNAKAPIAGWAIGEERGMPDWLYGLTLDNGFGDASLGRLYGSEDGGEIFNEANAANIGLAVSFNASAFAPDRRIFVVTSATGAAFIYSRDRQAFFSITAPGRLPLRDVKQVRGMGLSFLSPGAVVLYAPAGPPPPPPLPPLDVDTFFPAAPTAESQPVLTPPTLQLDIPVGETRTVEFGLDLPARPTPIDVFFLVDTSSSQEQAIDGLKSGLAYVARRMVESGLDVNFGLGEYQDSGVDRGSGVRYRRRVDIGRPSVTFLRELDAMRTRGGKEPHLTALHQMVTGSGIANPSVGAGVPAGQQANWRPGAVRVVLMDTDNEYQNGDEQGFGPDPDGPSFDQTVAALNAKDVHFVGIELRRPEDGQGVGIDGLLSLPDLTNPNLKSLRRRLMDDMAARTGSIAPVGGVDCDGDGTRELRAGEPLVCAVPFEQGTALVEMADPIVRLLSTFGDDRPARLVPVETSGLGVTTTSRADYSTVDVRFDNNLFFAATITCPEDIEPGSNHAVRVDALLGGEAVGSTGGNITCGKKSDPPGRVVVRQPQPSQAVQPAQPPPAPVTVTAVSPAAASAPAVATVGAPVGVVVEEDSPQHQVSTAGSGKGQGMMLASVPRPRAKPMPIVTWVGAAGLTFAFGGYAAQRERRRERARIR